MPSDICPFVGYPQTVNQSFSLNAESDLDLQYSMSLVTGSQKVTLYQAGDVIEGSILLLVSSYLMVIVG